MRKALGALQVLLRTSTPLITDLVKRNMACSRYEYVKAYERDDSILPNVWIVIRIDGKKFHKFSKVHNFERPNDARALNLMNMAAIGVMQEFQDIVISFGQSDEYSFVFRKETKAFNRRASKLLTYVTSLFSSTYVLQWSKFMTNTDLQYAPCFDGRVVLYPSDKNLRDYLSWRQADVHVNNLYNTTFWNLVLKGGLSNQEAEAKLRGTLAKDKNEILFSQFGINYNYVDPMFRKGTTLLRKRVSGDHPVIQGKNWQLIVPLHEDIIESKFWKTNKEILEDATSGSTHVCNEKELCSPLLDLQIARLNNTNQDSK